MKRKLHLYNTATRHKEEFHSIDETVGLYCCGPTVYNYAHIGNLRTYLFEDVLKRSLRECGWPVRQVENITDVGHLVSDADAGEDKMVKGAKREKKTVWEIAEFYAQAFINDIRRLNIEEPDLWCRATDHIDTMIDLVKRLEAKGYTYVAGGNVYFDVSRFPSYGDFANLNLEEQYAGARVDVDTQKRNPFDFVLWFTKSKFGEQEMQWDSPWGRGYPGWHLECSAMSMKYLGEQFDIHCGGIDHISVHHSNEIAQSEAATGKKWVNFWLHGAFLEMDDGKMAKSGNNFVTLETVIDRGISPLAYRFFTYSAHYRSPLKFSWDVLASAAQGLKNLKKAVASSTRPAEGDGGAVEEREVEQALAGFYGAVCDDLNMPQAVAAIWELLRSSEYGGAVKRKAVEQADRILALDLLEPLEEESRNSRAIRIGDAVVTVVSSGELSEERAESIAKKVVERRTARKEKNFEVADRIRDELKAEGIEMKDHPDGTTECVLPD